MEANFFLLPSSRAAHTFCIAQKVCKNARQNNARLNGRAGFCPLANPPPLFCQARALMFQL